MEDKNYEVNYKDSVIGYYDYSITLKTHEKEVLDKFDELMSIFKDWNDDRRSKYD